MNKWSQDHRSGNYQCLVKKIQKCSLRGPSVGPGPWKIDRMLKRKKKKKSRKVFAAGWNDQTLKARQCEYVKMPEDLPKLLELEWEVGDEQRERWLSLESQADPKELHVQMTRHLNLTL